MGKGPNTEEISIVWFTNGSRKDCRVEVGFRGPNFSLTVPLGAYPTVFQAKVHAIELYVSANFVLGWQGNLYSQTAKLL